MKRFLVTALFFISSLSAYASGNLSDASCADAAAAYFKSEVYKLPCRIGALTQGDERHNYAYFGGPDYIGFYCSKRVFGDCRYDDRTIITSAQCDAAGILQSFNVRGNHGAMHLHVDVQTQSANASVQSGGIDPNRCSGNYHPR